MKLIVFCLIRNNPHLDNYMSFVEFPKAYIGGHVKQVIATQKIYCL